MANINIGLLYESGRAKSATELWSEEELRYICEAGYIDPNRVTELRNKARLDEAKAVIAELEPSTVVEKPEKPLSSKNRDELVSLASSLHLPLTGEETRKELIEMIKNVNSESGMPDELAIQSGSEGLV